MFFLRKRADPLKVSLKREQGNDVGFCMGPRFVSIDRDTPLLLPPNLRDWVPSDPLSHFIRDAVDKLKVLKVGQITVAIDGTKVMANASTAYTLKRLHRMVGAV